MSGSLTESLSLDLFPSGFRGYPVPRQFPGSFSQAVQAGPHPVRQSHCRRRRVTVHLKMSHYIIIPELEDLGYFCTM